MFAEGVRAAVLFDANGKSAAVYRVSGDAISHRMLNVKWAEGEGNLKSSSVVAFLAESAVAGAVRCASQASY